MRILRQHASRKESIDDGTRVSAASVDLEADEQPTSANVADQRTLDRLQLREQISAKLRRALDQPLVVEHGERLQRDCRGERIAAERAAVIARMEDLHHFVCRDERRDRQHSAAQRLAECHPIRHDAFVLTRQKLAGAAHAGLDFVGEKEHAMLAADARALGEIARGRDDDAALALDWLDQECRGMRRNRGRERGGVAERNQLESGREWPEAVAVLWIG